MLRWAVLAALLLSTSTAGAFCRTTTIPVAADFSPLPDKCWDQGAPLFWRSACVSYSVQRSASQEVSFDAAVNAISTAFAKWTGSTCRSDGEGRSRVSIDVRDLGPVECANVDYNQAGGNQNVIVFRDTSWPHPGDTNNTLALTTVTFNSETGEIYDADMEINTADNDVTLEDPVPASGYDFASIVTHETGHFLGLAHSGEARSTMHAHYDTGATTMRYLTQDDVAGICEIYRADGTRAVLDDQIAASGQCDPTPRRGFTGQCAAAPKKACMGTSQVAAREPPSAGWIGLALGGVVILGVRARRRRGKPSAL